MTSRTDPRDRFSDRVAAYVRARPRYPAELIPLLAQRTGLVPGWVVADVGAGTGISSEPFLAHANTVWAVDPNPSMRAAAEARFSDHPRFRSLAGSAEATRLDDRSVDLIVVGQAFHWFEPAATRDEFRRVLRPPSPVAIVWNTRRTRETPFLRAYEALLLRHGTDYREVRHERAREEGLRRLFGGAPVRDVLPNAQVLDLPGLRERLLSSSYTPPEGDPRRGPILAELDRIYREHAGDGGARIEYETEIYTGFLEPQG